MKFEEVMESTLDPSNSMRSNERRMSRNDRRSNKKKKEVQRVEDDRALAEVVSVGGDADSSCQRLSISKMALYVCMMIFQYTAPSKKYSRKN